MTIYRALLIGELAISELRSTTDKQKRQIEAKCSKMQQMYEK